MDYNIYQKCTLSATKVGGSSVAAGLTIWPAAPASKKIEAGRGGGMDGGSHLAVGSWAPLVQTTTTPRHRYVFICILYHNNQLCWGDGGTVSGVVAS